MLGDPVARIRVRKQAGAMAREWEGHKVDSIGEETRRELAEQIKIAIA